MTWVSTPGTLSHLTPDSTKFTSMQSRCSTGNVPCSPDTWIPTSQSAAQTAGQTDECTSTIDSTTCHPSSGDKTLSTDLCRDEHPQVWTSHLPEGKHSWRLVASVHEATRSAVRLEERWITIRTTRPTSNCASRLHATSRSPQTRICPWLCSAWIHALFNILYLTLWCTLVMFSSQEFLPAVLSDSRLSSENFFPFKPNSKFFINNPN